MTYYRDLSPYSYSPDLPVGALNVGWLSLLPPPRRGKTSDEFQRRLTALCLGPKAVSHRGFHLCPFCLGQRMANLPVRIENGAENLILGSAVIMVRHQDGTVFAAPDMICHYVTRHRYLPPQKFIDAVMQQAESDSLP